MYVPHRQLDRKRPVNRIRLICLSALILILSAPQSGSAAIPVTALENEAQAYLVQHYRTIAPSARTEIKITPINRAVKLRECQQPIHFGTPRGNGHRISFKAVCSAPFWQLFIAAEVNLFAPVVVSRTSLPRNSVLSAGNLQLKEMDITGQTDFFYNLTTVTGWTTKRSLPAETILTADILKQPTTIQRHDAVLIEAQRNHVVIRVPGTALEEGSIGEQIRVRNDQSGIEIKAMVIAPGQVKVP